ncbi:MAG: response regulator [Anaerolineae bacterium]|jgi:two-component system cell cycle response regulator DivK|nr:response regulator [Anaerolineae bacterium]
MFGFTKDSLRGWDILVVEDEPDSLEVATRWLKLAGANVLMAENGKMGLDIARQHLPRLVLADLTMPVMDGWELLYELKQRPETASIPVIALTAHALSTTKARTLEAGFVSHISKPINPSKFVSQVLSIIKNVPDLEAQLPG